jgi:hypothetical protein
VTCDDSGNAFRGFVGVNFLDPASRVQVGVEAFYLDVGETTVRNGSGTVNYSRDGKGFGIAVTASGRF